MTDRAQILNTVSLRLVPFAKKHLTEAYVGWLNDPITVKYSRQKHRVHTLESCQKYVESFTASGNIFWAIEDKTIDNMHIGNLTVSIDPIDRIADIGIMIGNPSSFGKGYGFLAWQAALNHVKTFKDVEKITAGCMAENQAMMRIMEKSGMGLEARRPAHFRLEGMRVDGLYYGLLNK